jgi:hypothetical protein
VHRGDSLSASTPASFFCFLLVGALHVFYCY